MNFQAQGIVYGSGMLALRGICRKGGKGGHQQTRRTAPVVPQPNHSRRPKSPSLGRINAELPSLRFMSEYSADAIVANGVLPWQMTSPLRSAALAISLV